MSTTDHPQKSKPRTLADVLTLIQADPNLSVSRSGALCSGLRSFAKAVHAPLGELPVDLDKLRTRMKQFTPAMIGMSEGRWRNCLCQTRQALSKVGAIKVPARSKLPFAPDWAVLFIPLTGKHARLGLCRFARYCTEHAIKPEQVTDAVADGFLAAMIEGSLIKKPKKIHQTMINVWNQSAGSLIGWPMQQLRVPTSDRTYALPLERFPQSLQTEIAAYLRHLGGGNIMDDTDFQPLRPSSIRLRGHQIRIYLTALAHSGLDPHSLRSLRDAVEMATLKKGLQFFLDRAPDKSTRQAHEIAGVLLTLCRRWLELDDKTLVPLERLVAKIKPKSQGLAPKNKRRLRQFDDPDNVAKLLNLPTQLVAIAGKVKHPTQHEARLVQTAIAVELLLMVPIRIGNLARIEIGRHLIRSHRGIVHLSFEGHEVKNGMPIDTVLPKRFTELLDLYLTAYRPLLVTKPTTHLFPGQDGQGKRSQNLGIQISDCLKERCGLLMNPHLFRHFAAKIYLEQHPGHYGLVRLLHGHKNVETTTQYYCGTETDAAIRSYDNLILKLRGDTADLLVSQKRSRRR